MMRMQTKLLVSALLVLTVIVCTDAACKYARQKRSAQPVERAKRETVTCDANDKYRRADGKCNNLNNQDWGSAGIPFLRLLGEENNTYSDGYSNPKYNDTAGDPLPHPRTISNNVHFHLDFTSIKHSAMVMQWGQFLDHDITQTPTVDSSLDCCATSESVETDSTSPCWPIHVPSGDAYFDDGKCINFVRSAAYGDTGDSADNPREQYNAVTAFIDGSMVYGSSDEETTALRNTTHTYLLRVEGDDFLPENSDTSKCHYDANEPQYFCFEAGDSRVNAFFGLGAMQIVFMREHNRLANALMAQNSAWDVEKVFQEARRIVIAELQVITYNEWLPQVIGDAAVTTYNLDEYNYNYDANTNPSFGNVFSAAAFRFGHSMLPEDFTIGGVTYGTEELFKETKYVIDDLGDVVESLIDRAGQRADAWYVDAMRNKLDETDSVTKDGADIVALNIQRGRDHGLPDYNSWREYCGLARITGFVPADGSDFGLIQGRDLRDTYDSVDDIDLYSGGISEIPVSGAAVGPLYICLIAETLQKLRDGDRFFWETQDTTVGFSEAQRYELGNITLSRVLCDNVYDDTTEMRTDVFRLSSNSRECSTIRNDLDLSLWINE